MDKIDKSKGQSDRILVENDDKMRLLELSHMNIVPPEVGIFDEPTRCYRINLEWAKIVMGMVSWLAEISVWRDAKNEGYSAIQEILRFKVGEDCMQFELRQNPVNSCLIEQSLDGGDSWSPVFDFSLCTSIVDGGSETSIDILNNIEINNFENNFNDFTENVYNNYVNNYINSITDIAPELGYGDSDDEFRNDALCFALSEFVRLVCEARIQFFENRIDTAQQLLVGLGLATALVGIIGLSLTGVGTPAAAALAPSAFALAGALGLASPFYNAWYIQGTETVQEQYEDLQAREDVVCCLMSQLESANVDQDDFQNVSSASCGLSANAQAIFDACQILAGEDATYAAFVENMSIGFNSAKLGLLPACPCEPVSTEWCRSLDLTLFTHFDYSSTGGFQAAGVLTGTQWDATDVSGGTGTARAVGVEWNFGSVIPIDAIEQDYTSIRGGGGGNVIPIRAIFFNGGTNVLDTNGIDGGEHGSNLTQRWDFATINADRVRIYLGVDNTSGTPSGNGSIFAARLYGDGENPLGGDNC